MAEQAALNSFNCCVDMVNSTRRFSLFMYEQSKSFLIMIITIIGISELSSLHPIIVRVDVFCLCCLYVMLEQQFQLYHAEVELMWWSLVCDIDNIFCSCMHKPTEKAIK